MSRTRRWRVSSSLCWVANHNGPVSFLLVYIVHMRTGGYLRVNLAKWQLVISAMLSTEVPKKCAIALAQVFPGLNHLETVVVVGIVS